MTVTAGEVKANTAMDRYKKAHKALYQSDAPVMRYEKGWILVSCSTERMQFPTRTRSADLNWEAMQLEWKLKRQEDET